MTKTPIITIITVTYNAQSTLPPTLKSIKEQTGVSLDDFECIVMDGKSADNTVEIAVNSGIENLRVISEHDRGIYDAMNKAIDLATGEYLMFLNAGDALHSPTTLRQIIDTIERNDRPGVVYGQTDLVDEQRRRLGPRHLTAPKKLTHKSFAKGMLVCHQAFIPRRQLCGYYVLNLRYSADFDWCIRCLQRSKNNVLIDDVLIDYLNEGTTTKNRMASLRERYKIMCHYYGWLPTTLRHIGFALRFLRQRRRENKAVKSLQ